MSQQFIRRAAGIGWSRRAWMRLHEPRIVSFIYGIGYVVVTICASISVVHPPRTIEAAAGDVLMSIIAGACAIGGVAGVVTVSRGSWWAERYAVGVLLLGLAGYWLMVGFLTLAAPGSRFMQLMGLTLAILFVSLRPYWIWDRPFNPRRKGRDH